MYNSQNILQKIELLRKRMTEVALRKGFTSKESLMISQELDRLLNFYEKLQQKGRSSILK